MIPFDAKKKEDTHKHNKNMETSAAATTAPLRLADRKGSKGQAQK